MYLFEKETKMFNFCWIFLSYNWRVQSGHNRGLEQNKLDLSHIPSRYANLERKTHERFQKKNASKNKHTRATIMKFIAMNRICVITVCSTCTGENRGYVRWCGGCCCCRRRRCRFHAGSSEELQPFLFR